jgi:hypothetical protein
MRRVIWLHTPAVLWLREGTISPIYVHGVNDVRQTEIHTAEPLVPETSSFETELAIKKQQSHESPDIYHIRAEMIRQG